MSKSVTRRYEVLQGNSRFYCYGHCVGSKQIGVFIFALILIAGTVILFFVFDCPYLTQKLTVAIPIICVVLFIFVILVLFRTACTDPGILPRMEKDEIAYYEKQLNIESNGSAVSQMPRIKEITIKGKTVKLKYCYTCKLYRPPRSSHCSICDNCVGTQESTLVDAIKATPATVIELVICFFSMWSIICLCGYHTYLISSEVSTNEDIKDSFLTKRGHGTSLNPYDHGSIFVNFGYILCGPISPSLINPREKVIPKYYNTSANVNSNGHTNNVSFNKTNASYQTNSNKELNSIHT